MDYTLKVVILGTSLLGLVAGALGSFAVLRRQSLLGDAISHAALPGIGLAFLVTFSKQLWVLLLGAIVAGWIGTLLMMVVVKHTTVKQDAALGIILSVFFGFGLVILTFIQKLPTANQSGLTTFLFGNAATLLADDVKTMVILGSITLILLLIFWKEFKLLTFDQEFAAANGWPVWSLDIFLTSLIVLAIVIGLQSVGVVLMSALIIAPAAAARQWTDRLGFMVVLSALFGATSGVAGAVTSSLVTQLPTGPTIVLYLSSIVFTSLLFAPHRGVLWGWLRGYRERLAIREQTMLANMLLFSESMTDPFHAHQLSALTAIGRGAARKTMMNLKKQGLVSNPVNDQWALTKKGLKKAQSIQVEEIGS